MKPLQIMFVCLGNICRSPLAEAIARKKIKEAGLEKFIQVASSGTGDYHVGENADPRAKACATKNKVPMQHRAQQLNISHQQNYDYVIAMDEENLANVQDLFEKEGNAQLLLLRQFSESVSPVPITVIRPHLRSVPDPYWGGDDGFQEVFDMLEEAIENLLGFLKIQHQL